MLLLLFIYFNCQIIYPKIDVSLNIISKLFWKQELKKLKTLFFCFYNTNVEEK